ncbi:unnamed protein product [Amoebophrya sp. A120]|nr:unnamed protein product [Amoebophrya sp. A120]|eukprot:GSA120T00016409001.1
MRGGTGTTTGGHQGSYGSGGGGGQGYSQFMQQHYNNNNNGATGAASQTQQGLGPPNLNQQNTNYEFRCKLYEFRTNDDGEQEWADLGTGYVFCDLRKQEEIKKVISSKSDSDSESEEVEDDENNGNDDKNEDNGNVQHPEGGSSSPQANGVSPAEGGGDEGQNKEKKKKKKKRSGPQHLRMDFVPILSRGKLRIQTETGKEIKTFHVLGAESYHMQTDGMSEAEAAESGAVQETIIVWEDIIGKDFALSLERPEDARALYAVLSRKRTDLETIGNPIGDTELMLRRAIEMKTRALNARRRKVLPDFLDLQNLHQTSMVLSNFATNFMARQQVQYAQAHNGQSPPPTQGLRVTDHVLSIGGITPHNRRICAQESQEDSWLSNVSDMFSELCKWEQRIRKKEAHMKAAQQLSKEQSASSPSGASGDAAAVPGAVVVPLAAADNEQPGAPAGGASSSSGEVQDGNKNAAAIETKTTTTASGAITNLSSGPDPEHVPTAGATSAGAAVPAGAPEGHLPEDQSEDVEIKDAAIEDVEIKDATDDLHDGDDLNKNNNVDNIAVDAEDEDEPMRDASSMSNGTTSNHAEEPSASSSSATTAPQQGNYNTGPSSATDSTVDGTIPAAAGTSSGTSAAEDGGASIPSQNVAPPPLISGVVTSSGTTTTGVGAAAGASAGASLDDIVITAIDGKQTNISTQQHQQPQEEPEPGTSGGLDSAIVHQPGGSDNIKNAAGPPQDHEGSKINQVHLPGGGEQQQPPGSSATAAGPTTTSQEPCNSNSENVQLVFGPKEPEELPRPYINPEAIFHEKVGLINAKKDLFEIVRNMLSLADQHLVRKMLNHTNYEAMIGIMEFDPGLAMVVPHRQILKRDVKFKKVITFKNDEIFKLIDLNLRVQYVRDVAMARLLDDQNSAVMNIIVGQNLNQLIEAICTNSPSLQQSSYAMQRKKMMRNNGIDMEENNEVLETICQQLAAKDWLTLDFVAEALRTVRYQNHALSPTEKERLYIAFERKQLFNLLLPFLLEPEVPHDGDVIGFEVENPYHSDDFQQQLKLIDDLETVNGPGAAATTNNIDGAGDKNDLPMTPRGPSSTTQQSGDRKQDSSPAKQLSTSGLEEALKLSDKLTTTALDGTLIPLTPRTAAKKFENLAGPFPIRRSPHASTRTVALDILQMYAYHNPSLIRKHAIDNPSWLKKIAELLLVENDQPTQSLVCELLRWCLDFEAQHNPQLSAMLASAESGSGGFGFHNFANVQKVGGAEREGFCEIMWDKSQGVMVPLVTALKEKTLFDERMDEDARNFARQCILDILCAGLQKSVTTNPNPNKKQEQVQVIIFIANLECCQKVSKLFAIPCKFLHIAIIKFIRTVIMRNQEQLGRLLMKSPDILWKPVMKILKDQLEEMAKPVVQQLSSYSGAGGGARGFNNRGAASASLSSPRTGLDMMNSPSSPPPGSTAYQQSASQQAAKRYAGNSLLSSILALLQAIAQGSQQFQLMRQLIKFLFEHFENEVFIEPWCNRNSDAERFAVTNNQNQNGNIFSGIGPQPPPPKDGGGGPNIPGRKKDFREVQVLSKVFVSYKAIIKAEERKVQELESERQRKQFLEEDLRNATLRGSFGNKGGGGLLLDPNALARADEQALDHELEVDLEQLDRRRRASEDDDLSPIGPPGRSSSSGSGGAGPRRRQDSNYVVDDSWFENSDSDSDSSSSDSLSSSDDSPPHAGRGAAGPLLGPHPQPGTAGAFLSSNNTASAGTSSSSSSSNINRSVNKSQKQKKRKSREALKLPPVVNMQNHDDEEDNMISSRGRGATNYTSGSRAAAAGAPPPTGPVFGPFGPPNRAENSTPTTTSTASSSSSSNSIQDLFLASGLVKSKTASILDDDFLPDYEEKPASAFLQMNRETSTRTSGGTSSSTSMPFRRGNAFGAAASSGGRNLAGNSMKINISSTFDKTDEELHKLIEGTTDSGGATSGRGVVQNKPDTAPSNLQSRKRTAHVLSEQGYYNAEEEDQSAKKRELSHHRTNSAGTTGSSSSASENLNQPVDFLKAKFGYTSSTSSSSSGGVFPSSSTSASLQQPGVTIAAPTVVNSSASTSSSGRDHKSLLLQKVDAAIEAGEREQHQLQKQSSDANAADVGGAAPPVITVPAVSNLNLLVPSSGAGASSSSGSSSSTSPRWLEEMKHSVEKRKQELAQKEQSQQSGSFFSPSTNSSSTALFGAGGAAPTTGAGAAGGRVAAALLENNGSANTAGNDPIVGPSLAPGAGGPSSVSSPSAGASSIAAMVANIAGANVLKSSAMGGGGPLVAGAPAPSSLISTALASPRSRTTTTATASNYVNIGPTGPPVVALQKHSSSNAATTASPALSSLIPRGEFVGGNTGAAGGQVQGTNKTGSPTFVDNGISITVVKTSTGAGGATSTTSRGSKSSSSSPVLKDYQEIDTATKKPEKNIFDEYDSDLDSDKEDDAVVVEKKPSFPSPPTGPTATGDKDNAPKKGSLLLSSPNGGGTTSTSGPGTASGSAAAVGAAPATALGSGSSATAVASPGRNANETSGKNMKVDERSPLAPAGAAAVDKNDDKKDPNDIPIPDEDEDLMLDRNAVEPDQQVAKRLRTE